MKFIKSLLPDIDVKINNRIEHRIKSMQHLDEQDDRVYLKCAEYVPILKRGLVCDLDCNYIVKGHSNDDIDSIKETIRDLVLVYVNKYWTTDGIPEFEYVFYK